jgi:hypothetical protein
MQLVRLGSDSYALKTVLKKIVCDRGAGTWGLGHLGPPPPQYFHGVGAPGLCDGN